MPEEYLAVFPDIKVVNITVDRKFAGKRWF
jgi:hypothetical protein